MATTFVSDRNLNFLLHEVFDLASLAEHPLYREHGRRSFDMIIDATLKLAKEICLPTLREMDEQPPVLTEGRVEVHAAVRRFMRECGDGGWIAAGFPHALDGEQLPQMLTCTCRYIFAAANYSLSVYPFLTAGAARLIANFGGAMLRKTYLPPMLSGRWQGTMALTEPQAGSSLADIVTEAVPMDAAATKAGSPYRIRGKKIFISAGDHDGVDNVVHLLLAKIAGAPAGVKGISLFVVPKLRPQSDGTLIPNDVAVSQIYHKLGYRGCPITELEFGQRDDCHGTLVGAPHRGLFYMFQMMNEARIEVGAGAAAIAQAAYGAALNYARLRPQGRALGAKDPDQPPLPIIQHADVKRMLLFQKAFVEGSLALILQCARYMDLEAISTGVEMEKYALLLDLLTPVAKTYPSEMGILSTSQAIQCFGGYGYCEDFPVAQYYRDVRIHPIHEGTTGIQGLDLLGRKLVRHNGRALGYLLAEIQATIASARNTAGLTAHADALATSLDQLDAVLAHLTVVAQSDGPDAYLADATVFLEFFGIITIAWQWLLQAVPAAAAEGTARTASDRRFYAGKRHACDFFFKYELPKATALATTLLHPARPTLETHARHF
ncbi:MAG: acyl-CoA dehydrogenase [Desulfosarcinaceae bacterium]|nr:acyl-CoA dehydrogenase [Desulfosarcinaceae bacterium]